MRRRASVVAALAAAVAAFALPVPARSDPVLPEPAPSQLRWGGGSEDPLQVDAILEARLLGIPSGSRLATWPDRGLGLTPEMARIGSIRVGAAARLREEPLGFVLRLEVAELTRPVRDDAGIFDDDPGVAIDRLTKDAYVIWRPVRPAHFVIGRAHVPWSKLRQFDEMELPLGVLPYVVDRLAPDRRWGVSLLGDLGSIAYAAGAWEDLDSLEARLDAPGANDTAADPSAGGAAALAAHVEWIPIAPMMGSNPPGRIPGAGGPMPTPCADPWFDTLRASFGLGALWRIRRDGGSRLDATISAETKWRWLGVLTEAIVSHDGQRDGHDFTLAAHGSIMVTPIDALGVLARAEWDGGAGADGEWGLGAGATFYATPDRRSQVGLLGIVRRDVAKDTRADALLVVLQASL